MKITEFVDKSLVNKIGTAPVIGIDIGSRTAKAVLLHNGNAFVAKVGTGFDMQDTAQELLEQLFEQSGLTIEDIAYIVGTGYGRVSLQFDSMPNTMVSEISCHAMGVHYLDAEARTVIDIGGQDSKAIRIDPFTGKVVRFVMNDKCAAGTGRFLEKVARLLGYETEEIGDVALKAVKELDISSQCVVFAESEIVSLRASGEKPADIAAGVHKATAKRIYALLKRVDLEPGLQFSGGVANNVGMKKAIEEPTGIEIKETKLDMIYAGCFGAALYALKYLKKEEKIQVYTENNEDNDIRVLEDALVKARERFIVKDTNQKRIGYFCSYTPVEILEAAGVKHTRLFKAGNPNQVALGEILTKSTLCDMAKSCIGMFEDGDSLYRAVDRIYTFYTCLAMKKVGEGINSKYVHTEILNLPRQKKRENSIWMYREEMKNFRRDLEQYTGRNIKEEELVEKIRIYNQIRGKIRRISELRKQEDPPIKGKEFLEIVKGFYYIEPQEQLKVLDQLYDNLSKVRKGGGRRIRLMIVGGIEGDGDKRVLEIIEDEIGARVVVEDHCTGFSAVANDISEEGDPIESISDCYLNETPCAVMSPIEDRIDVAERLAKEYKVDGVIYTYLKFCVCYSLPKSLFVKRFQGLGIPVLELALDYSKSDEGQLKTRIEAFIEVLTEVMSEKRGAGE